MELECLEGRIHGARYYTVKPVFDWWTSAARPNWQDMMEWCVATLGPSAEMGVWEPGASWYANNGKFWFRDERDRNMFILRWA